MRLVNRHNYLLFRMLLSGGGNLLVVEVDVHDGQLATNELSHALKILGLCKLYSKVQNLHTRQTPCGHMHNKVIGHLFVVL